MDLTGKVDSAATAELVGAAVAGAAGTGHRDQVTDCKSILAIEARARAARPLKFHQRVLLSSARTMQHKIRWHRSHPEKRDEPWSEDDIGVYMAAAGDRGGSRKGRILQHFGQVETEAVLRDVSGRALAFATHRGSISIRPIKEVVTVEVARSYRRARDVHREEAKPTPRPPGGKVSTCAGLQGCGVQPEQCLCAGGSSSPRSYTTSTSTARTWRSSTTRSMTQLASSATQPEMDSSTSCGNAVIRRWCGAGDDRRHRCTGRSARLRPSGTQWHVSTAATTISQWTAAQTRTSSGQGCIRSRHSWIWRALSWC